MIHVRCAVPEDRPRLLECCGEVFGAPAAAALDARWRWRWELDPRLDSPGLRANVLEWRGTVLGSMSFVPAGLHVAGRPVAASWVVDAMVHVGRLRAAMRRSGAARRGPAPRAHGATTPDPRRGWAARMALREGEGAILLGKRVAPALLASARRFDARVREDAGSWSRRLSLSARFARAVGPRAGRWLAAVPNASLLRLPRVHAAVDVYPGDFDARFDELWDDARRTYPALSLRDARFLRWRYRQRPDASYVVLTQEDGARLRGYAVVRTPDRRRQKRGAIVDVLTRPDDDRARRDLLVAAARALRDRGADAASCYATHETLRESLRRAGFSRRRGSDPLVTRNLPDASPYFTEGDGDGP